ncbi:MAG: GNAT family N-acetyltransferase, partial [Dysgonamonadaceae bacterium]|nr:GNAT family N-acetyltransferase [Dysgonamonadaceae bacterium]
MQNKQNITVHLKCRPSGTWRAGNCSVRKLKHTVNKVSSLRGLGLGKMLMKEVAAIAVKRDCGRLEWSCLDWNEPSIRF